MLSVARMLQRFFGAVKFATEEESFAAVIGAAIVLVLVGTITYSLGGAGTSPTGSTSQSAR